MNIKFTKKEIAEILKDEFSEEVLRLESAAKTQKCFFRSGAEYLNNKQLINYLQGHEGNYFSLDCEIKDEFQSLLS